MPDWLLLMEESIIPYVVSKGRIVGGSFQHETDESIYVWIHRLEDEPHNVAVYEAAY